MATVVLSVITSITGTLYLLSICRHLVMEGESFDFPLPCRRTVMFALMHTHCH
jgi:hypothetical protein